MARSFSASQPFNFMSAGHRLSFGVYILRLPRTESAEVRGLAPGHSFRSGSRRAGTAILARVTRTHHESGLLKKTKK
jgi:hypothetical protein